MRSYPVRRSHIRICAEHAGECSYVSFLLSFVLLLLASIAFVRWNELLTQGAYFMQDKQLLKAPFVGKIWGLTRSSWVRMGVLGILLASCVVLSFCLLVWSWRAHVATGFALLQVAKQHCDGRGRWAASSASMQHCNWGDLTCRACCAVYVVAMHVQCIITTWRGCSTASFCNQVRGDSATGGERIGQPPQVA